MEEFQISPLRSLDDFLLGSARFQIPNFKDMEKWGNRVVNNLLYYQTNYFVMAIVIFLLVGVLHPVKMLMAGTFITLSFVAFYFFVNKESITQAQRKMGLTLIPIIGGFFAIYYLNSILLLLFGILLPICITFVHASMRLRNIKNKLSNKIEMVTLKKTPMGTFLTALGNRGIWPASRSPPEKVPQKVDPYFRYKY